MSGETRQSGFSLVEVVIALVILTVGMLALAAGTSWATLEVRMARQRTQRTEAVSSAMERVRASAYSGPIWLNLASRDSASGWIIGQYRVWYTVANPDPTQPAVRTVTYYSSGPTYTPGVGWGNKTESYVMQLNQPFP